MNLKYCFSLMLVFIVLLQAKSQTYKFLTTGFSVMERNDQGDWSKWSDLKDTSIVISLDTTKKWIY